MSVAYVSGMSLPVLFFFPILWIILVRFHRRKNLCHLLLKLITPNLPPSMISRRVQEVNRTPFDPGVPIYQALREGVSYADVARPGNDILQQKINQQMKEHVMHQLTQSLQVHMVTFKAEN